VHRFFDRLGVGLCVAGAACLIATLAVDFDSRPARLLMAASAVCFVPGAFLTLAFVRRTVGPPR
jgi:hypothetical protein